MVSLVQVSQYTVISAWNSMITPAVKWFVNGDIVYYNSYIYFLISYKILIWLPLFSYAWKATKKEKRVHAVFFIKYDLKWSNNNKKCA
jgi:hypothetical protein